MRRACRCERDAVSATLEARIESLFALPADAMPSDAEATVEELLACLESGTLRAAHRGFDGVYSG